MELQRSHDRLLVGICNLYFSFELTIQAFPTRRDVDRCDSIDAEFRNTYILHTREQPSLEFSLPDQPLHSDVHCSIVVPQNLWGIRL